MEKGLTIKEIINLLSKCDPDAYLMLDDDGISLEIVEIANEEFMSYTSEGCLVKVVYAIYRGQRGAAERMRQAMAQHISAIPENNDDKES